MGRLSVGFLSLWTGLAGCAQPSMLEPEPPAVADLGSEAPDLLPPYPTVRCAACFPLEELSMPLRTRGEELLLKALDAEALYTLAADIKPMSSGFVSLTYLATDPEPSEIGELRQILARFTCTDTLSAAVQTFNATFDGKRYVDGLIFHRPRFAETQAQHAQLFSELGATAGAEPLAVVEKVDADPTTRRFAGYGHLFGYPGYAVEFFVQAAEEERKTGKFVERDFIQIPTYVSAQGRFVYAVPKGHAENDEDRALRNRAERVLARYRALRAQYIGADKAGVLSLVRSWFDDGRGRCAPQHAGLR
jgi:hypothetical protein